MLKEYGSTLNTFGSHEHEVLKVTYWDQSMLIVRRLASSSVFNDFPTLMTTSHKYMYHLAYWEYFLGNYLQS